jgi:hypothetical protein
MLAYTASIERPAMQALQQQYRTGVQRARREFSEACVKSGQLSVVTVSRRTCMSAIRCGPIKRDRGVSLNGPQVHSTGLRQSCSGPSSAFRMASREPPSARLAARRNPAWVSGQLAHSRSGSSKPGVSK